MSKVEVTVTFTIEDFDGDSREAFALIDGLMVDRCTDELPEGVGWEMYEDDVVEVSA